MTATDGAGGPVDRPVTRPVAEPAEASNPAAGPAAGDPGNRASATAERGLTPGQGAWLVVLLLMTAAGSWWLGRRSRQATPPKTPTMPEGPGKSAPGGAKVEEPVSELLTLEFDAVMPDGTAKKLSCRLHGTHGSSLVGSGPVDLVIPDSSLSRVHGRIQGSDGILLYGDAGSNQGSWVDGVACLEGELFRIHEGSSLVLGAVHLALTSVRPEASASDE